MRWFQPWMFFIAALALVIIVAIVCNTIITVEEIQHG